MKPPIEVPEGATPIGEADPLWFVERRVWTDRMLEALRRGGPEGGRWYSLHDKVFCERTLRAAYAQVAANKGAPGVDGVSVEAFGERLDQEISRILEAWQAGHYRPQAIRRKWIPKPGSHEERPLGIPTVRDRVVQAALRMVMEPIFEMDFHPRSYGFRPGRSAKEALGEVLAGLNAGQVWVVDADLKGYFDSIPHGPLLEAVKRRVTDRRILGLLESFLKAGVMEDEQLTEPEAGSPQGGVISPLLANIYLNDLDHLMDKAGRQMIRYADDFVVLCRSEAEAQAALEEIQEWAAQAGLTLHPTKTRLANLGLAGEYLDFLGYRFKRNRLRKSGKEVILRLVRPKSLVKVKQTIRERTRRTSGESLSVIIRRLNEVLSGWSQYFSSAHGSIHKQLDQMSRRRLRAILAKRRKRPNWGGGSGHNRWPNAFFAEHGLLSLEEAHALYLQSHRGTR